MRSNPIRWVSEGLPCFVVTALTLIGVTGLPVPSRAGGENLIHTLAAASVAFPETPATPSPYEPATIPLPDLVKPIQPGSAQALPTLPGVAATASSLAFSPDGQILGAGYFNNTLRLWTLADSKPTDVAIHKGGLTSICFHPSGQRLATAGMDNGVILQTYPRVAESDKPLSGHTRWVRKIAFTPDGAKLLSVSDDRSLRIWNTADGALLHTISAHTDWIVALSVRPDGKYAATAGYDRKIGLWNIETGELAGQFSTQAQVVTDLAWSADGTQLWTTGTDHAVRGWNPATGEPLKELLGHSDQLHCLALHPGGRWLASAGADHQVLLWNIQTGENVARLDAGSGWVHALAWSPDGIRLAATGTEHVVRLWEFMSN